VESREAATRESGDVMAGTVVAEIGELVAGAAPGRQTEDEVTLFKSVGVAAEDIVAAALVYRLAGLPASSRAPTAKGDGHR
jgi:alanine dehydrogenase